MKIFPSINEEKIFISIVAFCLGLCASLAINYDHGILIRGVATLFTTFVGAYYAFRLNRNKEKELAEERNIESLNRALFQLHRSHVILSNYQHQYIAPAIKAGSSLGIRASLGPSNWDVKFDFNSLSFLVSEDKAFLLGDLLAVEEVISIVITLIEKRNTIHFEEICMKMEKAKIGQEQVIDEKMMEDIVGISTMTSFRNASDGLVENVSVGIQKVNKLQKDIHEVCKQLFPGKRFIVTVS